MEKPTDKQISILQKNNKPIPSTKQEATVVIGELFAKSDSEKAVKSAAADEKFYGKQNNSSYYVAYAKDLCIAIIEARKGIEPMIPVDKVMESAIICIKM